MNVTSHAICVAQISLPGGHRTTPVPGGHVEVDGQPGRCVGGQVEVRGHP